MHNDLEKFFQFDVMVIDIFFYSLLFGCIFALRGRPYMMSDGKGEGGSAKSDFISKGALIKHLMRGRVKKGQK